jgi:hypothetical protein
MKVCSKCGIEKELNDFTRMTESKDGLKPWCKECVKEYNTKYLVTHREENKIRSAKRLALHREENRLRCKKRLEIHREENRLKCRAYREKNLERLREHDRLKYIIKKQEMREASKEYIKSERGRLVVAKTRDRRKRQLGFNVLFENELDEEYEWHHVDDKNVVAMPVDLHLLYLGKNHREKLMPIVKQLYPDYEWN